MALTAVTEALLPKASLTRWIRGKDPPKNKGPLASKPAKGPKTSLGDSAGDYGRGFALGSTILALPPSIRIRTIRSWPM